ncbi:MAG: hypothetical protein AAGB02_05660 [Pseudomonadota bacterium]
MIDDDDIISNEDFDTALTARYRRLSLLTLGLATEAGQAAANCAHADQSAPSGRFERHTATMARAVWAHRTIEQLRKRHEIGAKTRRQFAAAARPTGSAPRNAAPTPSGISGAPGASFSDLEAGFETPRSFPGATDNFSKTTGLKGPIGCHTKRDTSGPADGPTPAASKSPPAADCGAADSGAAPTPMTNAPARIAPSQADHRTHAPQERAPP